MRISDITINNFRIYRGENHIKFDDKADKIEIDMIVEMQRNAI